MSIHEPNNGLKPWVPTLFAILPLMLILCIGLSYTLKHAIRAPNWSRPFVEEPFDDDVIDAKSKAKTPYLLISLWIMTFAGFIVQLCMALWLPWAQMPTVAWALALFILVVKRPRTAPIPMVIFYIVMFAAQVILLTARSDRRISHPAHVLGIVSAVLAVLAGTVAVNMPLRDPGLPSGDISKPYTEPTSQLRTPEDNMTLWQWMSVSWMTPLISVGYKRQLHDPDVWSLGYVFQHRHLHDGFRELRGTVLRRLIRANWQDLVVLGVLAIVELVANYSTPLLLQQLLLAMEIIDVTVQPAVTFGVLTLVARLIASQSSIFSLWFGRRCYERSRGELITMLYEKTLARKIVGSIHNEDPKQESRAEEAIPDSVEGLDHTIVHEEAEDADESTPLNGDANGHANGYANGHVDGKAIKNKPLGKIRGFFSRLFTKKPVEPEKKLPATMGKILNMFKNDAYEIAQRFWEFQTLLNKPLGLIISLTLVYGLIGWPCLLGVAIVIVAQLLNAALARVLLHWEKVRRKATDTKLQKTSQYIEAIRHLRWYGWHPTWLVGIMESRQRELILSVVTRMIRLCISMTNMTANGMLPVAAFYAYTELAGKQLRVDIAFPALQLFDMLQRELRDLPELITVLLNASVAVNRLEEFMSEPDKIGIDDVQTIDGDDLELKDATFAWPGATQNVLRNVSLKFVPGLNVIFGEVAAGKTALLQALLGELDLVTGEIVKPDKPIGYCAQTPWLQSMSIRDNILFSAPYEEARYKKALDVCALTPDLANFKDGDLSEIGENGIGLSGGQKARVALARAVYSRTDILMLDDPLSALDQQTAEWIATRCLGGELMKGRTIVLVTHRTDLCSGLAQQMIEISHGTAQLSDEQLAALSATKSRDTQPDVDLKNADKAEGDAPVPDKFIEDEHRAHGGVQARVYWQFIKAGGYIPWIALIFVDAAFHALVFVRNWFLKEWGEAYKEPQEAIFLFDTSNVGHNLRTATASTPLSDFFSRFPDPATNPRPWLIGFLVIALLQSAAWFGDQFAMVVLVYSTGKKMFREIMIRVSNATFRYYDITPVGRLMNRLTSDISTIDGNISYTLSNVIFHAISWVLTVIVIAGTKPSFLVAAVVLTITFVVTFMRFLPTSQSLRRLEMVSLSPLMSNFGALLDGLTTVRAFCAQPRFQDGMIAVTDTFQKMDHFYWSLQAWLQYRFDAISASSTFILTLLAIFTGVSPGLTAFVLRAAGKLVATTHSLCREYGKLQMDFVSVERIVELLGIEQEAKGSFDPPAWWPSSSSDVVFEDVVIRYAPHLDPALSGISFTVKGGHSAAVIGRTGSGKSTLALALLGTIIPESGRILIGGIDIASVDKQALRTRISFLAQDPVLFPGSMRQNLDPTDDHSDSECEAVLSRVCGRFGWTLATEIDTGGRNLSQGQRQLVGLCRAILRRSAIIIMDEATASIDMESAWEIQRVLREELKDSTVITIAHRPSAVRGADFCIELGKGKVIAQGRPDEIVAGGGSAGEGADVI